MIDWADYDDDVMVQLVDGAPEDELVVGVADDAVAGWLAGMEGDDSGDVDIVTDPAGWLAAVEGAVDDDFDFDEPDPMKAAPETVEVFDVDVAAQKPAMVERLAGLAEDVPAAQDRDDFLHDFLVNLHVHVQANTSYSQCRDGQCGLGDRFGVDLGDGVVYADCSGLIVGAALQAGLWIDPAAWWTGGMLDGWSHIEVDVEDRQAGDVLVNMQHAGVVDDDGGVIHASGSRGVVHDEWSGSWFEAQDDLRAFRLADLVEDDDDDAAPEVEAILDVIRHAESQDDYHAIVHVGADTWQAALDAVGVEGPVTALSVGQVRDVQEAWLVLQEDAGVPLRSTAVGAYQIISGTLQMLVDRGVVDEGDRFDVATQDRLAVALLESRGWAEFVAGDLSASDLARNLSMEWAGLPDPATGASYYADDGVNASTVTVDEVLEALR